MCAADGFHGKERGLLQDDDGRQLPMFTFVLRGGVGGHSCIDGSAAKMSQMSESLELKESDVLYSSWLWERECEREQELDALL